LADVDNVAFLDADFLHRAGYVTRHLDNRLLGFEFDYGLVFLDPVADVHQHFGDGAGGDVLAKFG